MRSFKSSVTLKSHDANVGFFAAYSEVVLRGLQEENEDGGEERRRAVKPGVFLRY
jgi:hypothetical protein